jgi:UDP-glucose 4-epimerase
VELVQHAFFHANPGDLFVKKAPASTVDVLARAVWELFGEGAPDIRVIGMRHGEKLHETLLSREEFVKAEDQGGFFRVPLDTRGLQYEKYFSEGEDEVSHVEDYASDNTERLDLEGTKALLLTIPEINEELARR